MNLLLSETLINTFIRYLVLSETTFLAYTRNYPLFRTIRDLMYGCACVWAFFIRPPIVPNGNGWMFSDFRSIRLFLTGWLWGVSITPLYRYAYWIGGWYRCACIEAYCIRPSIVSNGNGWAFSDFRSIHSSLTGWLWGVSITPIHEYMYLIDRWCRYFQVGAYCIRPSIVSNGNKWPFPDFRSIHSSLAEYLWSVSNTPLHGYTHWIDGWYRCFCVGAYCIRPSIVSNGDGWTFSDFRSIRPSLTRW